MLLFLLCCLLAGGRQALAADPEAAVVEDPAAVLRAQKRADLLREVQQSMGLGLLFITHDLRVAAQLCDSVIVMHKGQIVEHGKTADVYARPQHDYTRNLLASVPGANA